MKVVIMDVSLFEMPQECTTSVPENENNVDLLNYSGTVHQELIPEGHKLITRNF
jgi:hypothetical protein